jgi:surfeit locus 1 family protein
VPAWSRPRWIALTALAIVVIAVCIRLGFWQLDRLEGRREANARLAAGLAEQPLALERLLAEDPEPTYRRAIASGRYDVAHEVILYGRPLDGRPGHHVLTPLVLDDGRGLIVDRGWVPAEIEQPAAAEAAPPGGRVEVEGPLLAGQPGAATIPEGEDRVTVVRSVDLEAIGRDVPYELVPWYLRLDRQVPTGGELPLPAPLPEPTDGPHLSYAIQWFAFATVAAIGYVVLLRRELATDRSDG